MVKHRLIIWEPVFNKYVKDYEGNNSWSPSYRKREGIFKDDICSSHYECTCGNTYGTDKQRAKEHVKKKNQD